MRLWQVRYPNAIKCDLCKTKAQDLIVAEAQGWDWFTGFQKQTTHFCPSCLEAHEDVIRIRRDIAMDAVAARLAVAKNK